MSKNNNIRAELRENRFTFGLMKKIPCSKLENKEYEKILMQGGNLPKGIYPYEYDTGSSMDEFYSAQEADLTEAEIQEYLKYKQLNMIRTIKNCVVFFTVLTILGMVGYFFFMVNLLNLLL